MIVGGGKGQRMQSEVPKQFLLLENKPVIVHTIEVFQKYDRDISFIIVLPSQYVDQWNDELAKYLNTDLVQITQGGTDRFYSVKNGLSLIPEDDALVAIHDSVRPLVSLATIQQCFKIAEEKGNAIPVIEVSESVRIINEEGNKTIDRSRLRLIQTPQVFYAGKLKDAYRHEFSAQFTDDASVFEKAGNTINLVEGNKENIKITTPEDMEVATVFLKMRFNC
ncbi:MAG: 2-C-methyl-D-erythritol 4-phosphate cytidylyltransferase [Bacteroidales bacterium]|nr:2-C-methyl-D-erythritol 4-phosphate cytidylyltransferase [Bacteroidales bacterium]